MDSKLDTKYCNACIASSDGKACGSFVYFYRPLLIAVDVDSSSSSCLLSHHCEY